MRIFEHEGKEEEKKMKLRYKVIIDTLGEFYFSEIKAPININKPIEHREAVESPQKVMLSERMEGNALFMRGICKERKVIEWILESLTGYTTPHQIKVILIPENNQIPSIEWTISKAFPLKYTMPNYNANADTVEIEFLEIVYGQLIRIK